MSKKKTILITGTSKGIGKYLVDYYLSKGMIVFGCSRSKNKFKNKNYHHFTVDVSSEKSVKNMFLELKKNTPSLDILVNNAGLASMNHFLLTPKSKAQEIIDTNFIGTFLVSREASKMMKRNKYGRIINLTSIGTQIKLKGEAIYTASKAAVENLTVVMSRELASDNITVNAVGPTPTETDLIKFVPKDKINNIINELAFDRLTKMSDISNVTDFFISNQSDYVTGQFIFLGGA